MICLYGGGGGGVQPELRRKGREGVGCTILATTLCANHEHFIHYITNNTTTSLFVYVCMFLCLCNISLNIN